MKKNHSPIIALAIFIAVAFAVSSSPFHDGWVVRYSTNTITGAVPTVVKPVVAPEINTLDVKPGLFERIIIGIFGNMNVTQEETPVTPEEGCCSDQQAAIDDIIGTVNDMQDRIDVLENRMNQPCSSTTITSGSCDTACQNMGFKCTGAMTIRWKVETHIIGANSESVLRTNTADCDYDWYMNFPEVYDQRSCFCC